jgi:hypothetical protein
LAEKRVLGDLLLVSVPVLEPPSWLFMKKGGRLTGDASGFKLWLRSSKFVMAAVCAKWWTAEDIAAEGLPP